MDSCGVIVIAFRKWVATENAFCRKIRAFWQPIFFYGVDCIFGTCRQVAASYCAAVSDALIGPKECFDNTVGHLRYCFKILATSGIFLSAIFTLTIIVGTFLVPRLRIASLTTLLILFLSTARLATFLLTTILGLPLFVFSKTSLKILDGELGTTFFNSAL